MNNPQKPCRKDLICGRVFMYNIISADRQIGICRAVWAVVCGWMRYAALPPAFMRGVVRVAHTGTGGSPSSAYLSQKRTKKNSKHRKIILFDALLPGIRTPPVPALAQGHFNQGMIAPGNHWNFDSLRAAPPSQVRGARRLTTRAPKLVIKFQFVILMN